MKYQLNEQQQFILQKAVEWYNDKNAPQVFQYAGGPGTGKSVLLHAILDSIGLPEDRVACMAFTGAAAVNMRLNGMKNANTIHYWIYTPTMGIKRDSDGSIVMDEYFNVPKETLQFKTKPLNGIYLMVIDEGYMVPFSMKQEIEAYGIKILVCGDSNQLPPVNDNPAYLTDNSVYRLTQIMRQAQFSSIPIIAERCRLGLPISYGYYGDVLVIPESELTDGMLINTDIIICNRNATRDEYNSKVRRLLNFTTDFPSYNERVICRSNNKRLTVDGINLANGLIGTVRNFPDVSGFVGDDFIIDFLPDILSSPFEKLKCSYKYFKASYKEKERLKYDKYITGNKFEYAYAISTYLAQGSQYNNVIYIAEWMNPSVVNTLNYVGVTRAKKQLIYVVKK